jgi:hypothetical protein
VAKIYGKPLFVGEFGLRGFECSALSCGTGSGCWSRSQRRCLYNTWLKRARDGDVGVDAIAPWGFQRDGDDESRYSWYCCDEESSTECRDWGSADTCPSPGTDLEPRYRDIVDHHAACSSSCTCDPDVTGCTSDLSCP